MNNNNDNSILFYSIWRNKFILNNILNHLKLFNLYYKYTIKNSFEEILEIESRYNSYILELEINTNEKIKVELIPKSVKAIKFNSNFNEPLLIGDLPFDGDIESIIFGNEFNQPISKEIFPQSIKHLDLGLKFNQTIESLPPNLQQIKFGDKFNKPLTTSNGMKWLPDSIEKIIFGKDFNQKINIDQLPHSLTDITFGENYILKPPVLPNTIKSINFGNSFQFGIEPGYLPKYLENLNLGNSFNKPLKYGSIPNNLQKLTFGSNYNQPFKRILPTNLKELIFDNNFTDLLEPGDIPISVNKLTLYKSKSIKKDLIPSSVTNLKLYYFKKETTSVKNKLQLLEPGIIPSSVKELEFIKFNQKLKIGAIPEGVIKITFNSDFNNQLQPGTIPSTCKFLSLGNKYNQSLLIGSLPTSIETLIFGKDFNQPLSTISPFLEFDNSDDNDFIGDNQDYINNNINTNNNNEFNEIHQSLLPPSLTKLHFGSNFKQLLFPGSIPEGVLEIKFGKGYNQNFNHPNIIPKSCTKLIFDKSYHQKIEKDIIDLSKTSLYVGNNKITSLPYINDTRDENDEFENGVEIIYMASRHLISRDPRHKIKESKPKIIIYDDNN